MLRSLFTGISGLSVHQTMLDVTSNNIANVNTTGFKSASTRFEDTFSQLVKSGAAPRLNERGGMNPAQVGLGVKLQSITNNFTGGAAQNTGRNLDTMINGDGFFVLKKTNGTQVYTRNGSFGLDAQGQVVAADGSFVQGWMADKKGKISASGQTQNLVLPLTQTFEANPTKKITYGGNLPADKVWIDPSPNKRADEDNAFMVTQTLTVYDDKGDPHNVLLKFERSDSKAPGVKPKWKVMAYDAEAYKHLTKKAERDTEITAGDDQKGAAYKLKYNGKEATSFEIEFETDGTLKEDTKKLLKNVEFKVMQAKVTADKKLAVKDGVAANPITMDLSALTGYAGVNSAQYETIDGNSAGTLTGFGVEADGTIRGTFSNGDTRALAKIATASFSNPLGLEKAGASYFVESGNSGQPQIGEPGSGTRGAMTGGAIEMSNVDLAAEFTNLILSQRGFQANTRVITTSDEILQELVSMKR
ncbi:flagellar hook-basal body protein [Mobiluncus mulieris 28-1]|uniref:flagellar hook protein FlgE n=1 Tax=Mobiluncus mulieris TaxID=2052 RepID=UPI0001BE7EA2|nr:flagellar hook protein FlgE [Mobiluncus mulieris]EEZ92141.1 flagellar hook-basal body protein [Mobiluncus mulieris 28-1]